MQNVHFRLTSVAQKRCCLSSLLWRGSRAKRASRAPWVRKFAKQKIWLWRSVRTTVRAPTRCKSKPNVWFFWRESVWPPASCEADTTKESIKTKTESGNCFCIRVFSSINLRLIVMSTNLEYREIERQGKKESRATGHEAQREKELERERKNKRRHFLLEEVATRVKMSDREKNVNKDTSPP